MHLKDNGNSTEGVQNKTGHLSGSSSALTLKKMLANGQENILKTRKHCPFHSENYFLITRKAELCSILLFHTTFSSHGQKPHV